jgi:hypothetical protein
VVVALAVVWRLQVVVVAFSGVLSIALALYLFQRRWPQELKDEESDRRVAAVQEAIAAKTPRARQLSPLEYRREREKAQRMIAEKAAPALAKAIRGILHQADARERGGRRG